MGRRRTPAHPPAAAAPVLVGSGAAAQVDSFAFWPALLALGVALALQVGVNYANDYSDGVRGTDVDRVGPMRLTASGAALASQVRNAAFACFGVAAVLGLGLVALTGHWWLLAVGALAIVAAWFYTGARTRTGTGASARSACSCSSGSSRCWARRTRRPTG